MWFFSKDGIGHSVSSGCSLLDAFHQGLRPSANSQWLGSEGAHQYLWIYVMDGDTSYCLMAEIQFREKQKIALPNQALKLTEWGVPARGFN